MASFFTPISLELHAKSFSFELGAAFRGLTITETSNGFNIILRASLSNGTPVYSMTVADDIGKGLSSLIDALSGSGGAKLWHFDKYASNGRR